MKYIAMTIAFIFCLFAINKELKADNAWITIAASYEGTMWQAKAGSLEFATTKSGIPIAVVTGRVLEQGSSTIEVQRWYVSATDCAKRQGVLVTLNISGEFMDENDFVFESGNVASGIAEQICGAVIQDFVERMKSLD